MEQLRVPKLLAGALGAVSGAVVASFFGVEGTLIGAALVSLLVAPAEALYTHSLVSGHKVARRSLLRRVGDQADASENGASEEGASQAQPQPIRWQRVAAALAFGIAVAAITVVVAVAKQPLASLVGSRPRPGGKHIRWRGGRRRGRPVPTGDPGAGDGDHLAVGLRTNDDGAGGGSHNDRAGGNCARHHGRTHHRAQHPRPNHPEAVTRVWWCTWNAWRPHPVHPGEFGELSAVGPPKHLQ